MQLVELQRNVHEAQGGDVAVFGLSRDTVEVLAAFADAQGIGFPMFADVGSIAIEELGLLNEHIESDQEYWGYGFREERHGRLPYPGTFILDADGELIDKRMERDFKTRSSGAAILVDLGLPSDAPESAEVVAGPGARITAWTDDTAYFPHQRGQVRMRIDVEDGYHLYVPPNPSGYTDLNVMVEGPEGLQVRPAVLPEGEQHRIEGLDEEFTVVEGPIELVLDFMLIEGTGSAVMGVDIAFQACSDRDCLVPTTLHVDLAIDERARV